MINRLRKQGQETRERGRQSGPAMSPAGDCCSRLTQVGKGCRCRIKRHHARGPVRQRLLDLGFVPDAEVEMVRCATLGDPLEIRLGDYYVTLRKREADLIEVRQSDLPGQDGTDSD